MSRGTPSVFSYAKEIQAQANEGVPEIKAFVEQLLKNSNLASATFGVGGIAFDPPRKTLSLNIYWQASRSDDGAFRVPSIQQQEFEQVVEPLLKKNLVGKKVGGVPIEIVSISHTETQ